jgi:hypothetical protein
MSSPFIIVVAVLHLSAGGGPGTIEMAAEPFDTLDVCKASVVKRIRVMSVMESFR